MNKEKQRIVIAELRGWVKVSRNFVGEKDEIIWVNGESFAINDDNLPDYLNDLNATHEAVMGQSGEFLIRYRNALADLAGGQHYHNATAPQRAEAFLRTLGLWEEDNQTINSK